MTFDFGHTCLIFSGSELVTFDLVIVPVHVTFDLDSVLVHCTSIYLLDILDNVMLNSELETFDLVDEFFFPLTLYSTAKDQ